MTTFSTDGFLNKRDAALAFQRSHRSLSRDVTTAVRLGDAAYLAHWRLETQDGTVRSGTEVTIELLDALRDAGQVPTWWAEPEFLALKYGRRGEENASTEGRGEAAGGGPAPVAAAAGGGAVAGVVTGPTAGVVPLLERQIAELQSDKRHLLQELERSYELRKEDNELREQNNKLMEQLYGLLTSMQQTPGNTFVLNQAPAGPPAAERVVPAGALIVAAGGNASEKGTAGEPRVAAESVAAGPPREPAGSPSKKPRGGAQARSGKSAPKSRGKPRKESAVDRYLPTLSGWFHRGR